MQHFNRFFLLCAVVLLSACSGGSAATPTATVSLAEILPTKTSVPPTPAEPTATLAPTAVPLTIQDVIKATVRIGVLNENWEEVGHASGSIIDGRGLILTNFHVIGDNDTGQYYNRDGISYVYITLDPRDPPKLQFISQVVDADPGKDLAVLRIIATTNGEPPANCLDLPAVKLNTTKQVEIGEQITSVGYSGVGGNTVSIASGQVVGFEQFSMSELVARSYEAIKYDASDSRGSSGGPIVNGQFEQVAVVFGGISDEANSMGYARPVSLANDLISSANLVRIPGCNGAEAASLFGPEAAQPAPTETPATDNAQVYDIQGRIIDRMTGKPIPGAFIVLLKPGYNWLNIDMDKLEDYIWTFAESDRRGIYVLSVTDEMVNTPLSMIIGAEGYTAVKGNNEVMINYYDRENNTWVDFYLDPEE